MHLMHLTTFRPELATVVPSIEGADKRTAAHHDAGWSRVILVGLSLLGLALTIVHIATGWI